MQESQSGGFALRVFVKGDGDLDAIRPRELSGEPSVGEASGRHKGFPILFYFEPSRGIEAWVGELNAAELIGSAGPTAVFTFRPDVIICSIAPEVDNLTPPEAEGIEVFKRNVMVADEIIRSRLDANVLWLNTTTVDLASHTSTYQGAEVEARSLRIHRLNLALIELSNELGVSIVDVDRVLAEAGLRHLSRESWMAAVHAEVFRVLEDYGYFDDRPIAVQVGQRTRGGI